jgi:hypothetical protein
MACHFSLNRSSSPRSSTFAEVPSSSYNVYAVTRSSLPIRTTIEKLIYNLLLASYFLKAIIKLVICVSLNYRIERRKLTLILHQKFLIFEMTFSIVIVIL